VVGKRRSSGAAPAPLRQIDYWLAPYRRRWQASLDALERHLDDMDHPKAEELS
jgi:hypothetical protein